MHIIGVVVSVVIGIYTLSWSWILLKDNNRAGAAWSFLLAISSLTASLYYFIRHGFFP
jgi:heme O synthase-like polyprenyltransferase